MTTLLLARHGETDWNREFRIQGSSDIELNELGRQQAQFLAQELTDVDLDAIYSSDLSRAQATAAAVAADARAGREARSEAARALLRQLGGPDP